MVFKSDLASSEAIVFSEAVTVATKNTNVAPTNVVKILLCLCRGVLRKESKQKVAIIFKNGKTCVISLF